MEELNRHFVKAMGIPPEFVTGDTNYSGCCISLEILERQERASQAFLATLARIQEWAELFRRAYLAGFRGEAGRAIHGLSVLAEHFEDWSYR